MDIRVKFTPAAPAADKTFTALKLIITDSIGARTEATKVASQVNSQKIDNEDGTYSLVFPVSGVAIGAYSGRLLSLDQDGATMGTELSFTGTAGIDSGAAWFPQPTAAA